MSLYGTGFDAWLTNDNAEFYDESAIDERVKELTSYGESYDYRTFENFLYAAESFTLEQAKIIESYLADPLADMAQFGRFIKCAIIEDMEKIAEAQARREQDE